MKTAARRSMVGSSSALAQLQADRLQAMLAEILPRNRFYACKFADAGLTAADVASSDDLTRLPFTTKAELLADQAEHPPYGRALTYPLPRYNRLHQTSGTAGRPLRWLDTPDSWNWLLDGCWGLIYEMVGLQPEDRLFFPFSFGPFLGFWAAFEAACRLGYLCLPGGGMSSSARLRFMLENKATILVCTPTYALRLAEAAQEEGIRLADAGVRAIIVAGEPGGSIPATRNRIETAWRARVFDHSGMTEIGSLGVECLENPGGLHLLETECLAEIINPATGCAAAPGDVGELVLTNLGRWGSPLLRYRTGDLARADLQPCPCGRPWLRLQGGILGRTDDMVHLSGNNIYPGALEAVIQDFPEVAEFRIEMDHSTTLPVLRIQIESKAPECERDLVHRVDRAIQSAFLLRAEVHAVPAGSLPRFELKARRFTRKFAEHKG